GRTRPYRGRSAKPARLARAAGEETPPAGGESRGAGRRRSCARLPHRRCPHVLEQEAALMARKRSRAPGSPAKVLASGWKYIAGRAIREFLTDHCIDLAAGLTYFAVLAIFPALLAVFSLLGVIGQEDRTVAAIEPILKDRLEEHTSELQSRFDLVCRLLLDKT